MACSQFVHICRRSKGNFSLSAAPIITDFFRFHKQIISHYCDHYLRSHHPPAVSFRTGVHDPGIWLPLSSRVTALENRRHLSERSELCRRFSALSSLPGAKRNHPRIPSAPGRKLTAYSLQHPQQTHTRKSTPCIQILSACKTCIFHLILFLALPRFSPYHNPAQPSSLPHRFLLTDLSLFPTHSQSVPMTDLYELF